mmetsp:Transcript_54034/g.156958  ORF Transcript_54034/g.156958 Transcript_54034/m.156958 type:complete len:347 (+) Transcript_54034:1-1041(+)
MRPSAASELAGRLADAEAPGDRALEAPGAEGMLVVPAEGIADLCCRIDRLDAMCGQALEARSVPLSDTDAAAAAFATLDATSSELVAEARILDDIRVRIDSLMDKARQAISERPMLPRMLADICDKVSRLDAICQKALEGQPEASPMSSQINDRIATLDTICEEVLSSQESAAAAFPLEAEAVASPSPPRAAFELKGFSPHSDASEDTRLAELPLATPSDAMGCGIGDSWISAITPTSPLVPHAGPDEAEQDSLPQDILLRITALLAQMYSIAPRIMEMAQDIQHLAASQQDQARSIGAMRDSMAESQKEFSALKTRLQLWIDCVQNMESSHEGRFGALGPPTPPS